MARTQSPKHRYSSQDYNLVLESPRVVLRSVITSAGPRPRVLRVVSGVMLVRQGHLHGRHASPGGEWWLHAPESLHVATLKDISDS